MWNEHHLSLCPSPWFEWCDAIRMKIVATSMDTEWIVITCSHSLVSHSQVVMFTEVQWHLNVTIKLTDLLKFSLTKWHGEKHLVSCARAIDWSPLYHMKSCTLITLVALVTSTSNTTDHDKWVSLISLFDSWVNEKILIIMHCYLFRCFWLSSGLFTFSSGVDALVSFFFNDSGLFFVCAFHCRRNGERAAHEGNICCEGVANLYFLARAEWVFPHAFVLISEFIPLYSTVVSCECISQVIYLWQSKWCIKKHSAQVTRQSRDLRNQWDGRKEKASVKQSFCHEKEWNDRKNDERGTCINCIEWRKRHKSWLKRFEKKIRRTKQKMGGGRAAAIKSIVWDVSMSKLKWNYVTLFS